ncbi:MAG TPA: S53 family peptidase [Phycisphaerae bacterium]|nr:S53 family peptidase [Phycisphaerae bacterium]
MPLLLQLEERLLFSTTGFSPAVVRDAYGFDQVVYSNGTGAVAADGRGQTIAIVTAFDAPTISNDLDVFDKLFSLDGKQSLEAAYGAAATVLTKHEMSTSETADASWSQEASLDVEWAHAIAPGAHIVLVEAASDGLSDLLAAADYAREQPGVSVVSMSWGAAEYPTEWVDDNHFLTPTGHPGVTFVTSAGDTNGTSWPAVSPYVLSVGGTTLLTQGATYLGEAAWTDTGGGTSSVETAPAFETALTGSVQRSAPDVAYDANPSTGFYVYDSTDYQGSVGWQTFGGTSAGAPQWAALVAIANQGRAMLGKGTLDGATQTLPAIDALPQVDFHDITLGSTGSLFFGLSATPGYDDLTGRGTPVANRVIIGLLGWDGVTANVVHNTTNAPVTPPHHRFHRFDEGEAGASVADAGVAVKGGLATAGSAVRLPVFYRVSLLPEDPAHGPLQLL